MDRPPALILCCSKAGLAVIRALTARGVPVVAIRYGARQVGAFSRRVSAVHDCPDPNEDESGFVASLMLLADRYPGGALVPTDDASLVAVSRNKERLSQAFRVVAEDWEIVRQLIEKRYTYEMAQAHEIPHPTMRMISSRAEATAFARTIGYPCLVKPSVGHAFFKKFKSKMIMVRDESQLRRIVDELADYAADMMLCEFIPGDDGCGANYNSFFVSGQPHQEFTAQKVRLKPSTIGFPTTVVSRRLPEVIELGRRMIAACGLNGFSCTEFKRDPRDGIFKLMEVNARANYSGMLALRCGIDFPMLGYLQAIGEPLPQGRLDQLEGVHWIDEERDIKGLLDATRSGRMAAFVKPYLRRPSFAITTLRDPMPAVRLGLELLGELSPRRRVPDAGPAGGETSTPRHRGASVLP